MGEVYIEKYQDVKPAQPVISFIDINRLKIEIYVTQNIAFASHPTDSVRIYFDASPISVIRHRCEVYEGDNPQ